MFGLSPGHLIVLLLVVVLVFGTKKLRNMGGDLGAAVKGFKDGMKGDEDEDEVEAQAKLKSDAEQAASKTIDASVRDRQV